MLIFALDYIIIIIYKFWDYILGMNAKNTNFNLTKLAPYANQWVALSLDRKKVLASGKKIKDVTGKLKTKDAVLFKVFSTDTFYMPRAD